MISGFQKVVKGQEVALTSQLDSESNNVKIETDRSHSSSNKGKGGFMMFSKVQAGKEVTTENNIFNYPRSMSNSNIEEPNEVEHKPRIAHPQFNFVKV